MAISREQKATITKRVKEYSESSESLLVAHYTGMDCAALFSLRQECAKENIKVKVIKNKIAKIAFAETKFEPIIENLTGQLIYFFSMEDMVAAPRVIKKFTISNDNLKPAFAVLEGKLYDESKIEELASLPSKEVALSMLCRSLLSTITNLAITISAVPKKIVLTVNEISKKKS